LWPKKLLVIFRQKLDCERCKKLGANERSSKLRTERRASELLIEGWLNATSVKGGRIALKKAESEQSGFQLIGAT
jgi:hypothetical protein